jgi:replicative DNA helicase
LKTMQRIEAHEDALIGILLLWPELALTVPFDINVFTKWRFIVVEIIRQLNSGIKPDLITMADSFPEKQGLLMSLGNLAKNCPSSANYIHYLNGLSEMVAEVSVYKELQAAVRSIAEGKKPSDVFAEIVNYSIGRLAGKSPKSSYTLTEAMALLSDNLEKMHENDGDVGAVKSGIAKLDDIIGKFHPSNLVIVGARPAVGKTAFAVSIGMNMVAAGKRIGFISSEMSVLEIARRIMSKESGVAGWKLRDGKVVGDEWTKIANTAARISRYGFLINDKPQIKISEVVMQCRAWDMAGGLDVVIVDYLTRIKPDKLSGNQNLDVGELATQFKNLARMLNIPVIVLAQLNRGSTQRADKTPNMSDLRDSGIIEQEADCIVLLHQETDEGTGQDKNYIIVEKNRHGQAGIDLLVDFDKQISRWR